MTMMKKILVAGTGLAAFAAAAPSAAQYGYGNAYAYGYGKTATSRQWRRSSARPRSRTVYIISARVLALPAFLVPCWVPIPRAAAAC